MPPLTSTQPRALSALSGIPAALDRGALVLAPTALAAGSLRAGFDRRSRSAGRAVWEPANLLSWQQWLGSLWTSLVLSGHETRLLLNTAQEELLWRDLITPSLDAANQASSPGFATLARSAFALAAGYNVTARLASAAGTEDTEQFARWAAEFTRTCGRHGYLPAARLSAALLEHLQRQALTPPPELHLAHFLDLPPADAALLDGLRRAGVHIVEHAAEAAAPVSRLTLRAASETEELRAAAHWLRGFLDRRRQSTGADPLPAVHVVLADPHADRAALESVFREVLAPELHLITADLSSAPWEFAAGRPLAVQPVIATLLRLLRGLLGPLPVDDVTALLLSPHLGPDHDRDEAAQFDASALRERPPLRPEMTLRELHQLAQRSAFGQGSLGWLTPLLAVLREAVPRRAAGEPSTQRPYAAWASFFRELAAAAGWPGSRAPSPAEFAATEAYEHLLDSVAALDFTGRRVPLAEALAALEHQLGTATLTLPAQAPLRILSAAEAAAIPADAVVLLQATDAHWPPAARPHPLLPWSLQAAAGMPGADPGRDAARTQQLTDALFAATPHVLVTYAAEANEAPQRLAPALAQLASAPAAVEWPELPATHLLPPPAPPVTPEHIVDSVPLPPLPSPQVPGGARVLQLQAACGFRAFAEIRLRSTEPRTSELGIDAGRAGNLLHGALDHFWQRVGSQPALLALGSDDLDEHLAEAIRRAFDKDPALASAAISRETEPWDRAYRALQMQRLFDLLKAWLVHEKARAPFTVLGREQQRRLSVGPLELQLRIDRIDRIDCIDQDEDGAGTILIDYKTGLDATPRQWETDRPDEPQLPLYTLLPAEAPLRGLAFARVRAGQMRWAGAQAAENLIPKARLEPDLEALIGQWREVLTRLAERFAAGDHSVHPKSFPTTCTYCGQRFLCRLDPGTLADNTADPGWSGRETEEVSFG